MKIILTEILFITNTKQETIDAYISYINLVVHTASTLHGHISLKYIYLSIYPYIHACRTFQGDISERLFNLHKIMSVFAKVIYNDKLRCYFLFLSNSYQSYYFFRLIIVILHTFVIFVPFAYHKIYFPGFVHTTDSTLSESFVFEFVLFISFNPIPFSPSSRNRS